jgi:hypothetical protein
MDQKRVDQEGRLKRFVEKLGYLDTYATEEVVKRKLGLPTGPNVKCADLLGIFPGKGYGPRVIIGESKGTEVRKSLTQLGNAAAGVLQKFGPGSTITLLLYREKFTNEPAGWSPGGGFVVGVALNHPHGSFQLIKASETAIRASADCELGPPWNKWVGSVAKLPIAVYVEDEHTRSILMARDRSKAIP